MPPVVPPAPDASAYAALPRDDPRLAAGVDEIARRHGVRAAGPPVRFADGSLPVFAVGAEHVVKLYPPCYAHELGIEASCLGAVEGRLGIPTPRVVATGDLEGWAYLLMSRLHGESLAGAWPRIPAVDRERLVETLGGALAALHRLPTAALEVPRPKWPEFVRTQIASATSRQRARGLGEPWFSQIEGFLAEVRLPESGPGVLLHTEVMREHLLAAPGARGWALTGLFDFEPAMVGAADYEFASVGVFVTCGQGGLLRRLLLAYGKAPESLDEGLSRRFLAYALVHRYSNLRWYLERLKPSPDVQTLDALARAWWPLA